MISIVTYGRNDNYGFNLPKRTALGFNCLAEVLSNADEIIFVDYNTPDHLPTLPESIWDTLTDKALSLIKVIRISHDLHEKCKADSPLPILENVSRNAAITRSNPQNHWILSTNPDVLLVLASPWRNLAELLKDLPDSFYEMPRFDIPESVWSSFCRTDPTANMAAARDWLSSHKAAVAETVPDWRFQKYLLFDAPGDFQLAPRSYFLRLRGFDESMNKYLHSDSNLAKRMWLLNGGRTDHLLGKLWVLHQDHYLSGEWTKNIRTIVHNDLHENVLHQDKIEANDENWGLKAIPLPVFSLCHKVQTQRIAHSDPTGSANVDLLLTREPDWGIQPVHHLSHYDPDIIMLYLRENLQLTSPQSLVAYIGQSPSTLDCVRRIWGEVSPLGTSVCDLTGPTAQADSAEPDVLLVDFYYNRPDYWERRVRLVRESVQRRVDKKQISSYEAGEEISIFTEATDMREWETQMRSLWKRVLPNLRLRPGSLIILLGCSQEMRLYAEFEKAFSKCYVRAPVGVTRQSFLRASYQRLKQRRNFPLCTTRENPMEPSCLVQRFGRIRKRNGTMDLQTLYVHHRLVVLRVK
jgi:hypothetical protein